MRRERLVVGVLLFVVTSAVSFGDVVAPNELTSAAGNSQNCNPFAPEPDDIINRYQQVYGSSSLGSIAGTQIVGVAFRMTSNAPFNVDIPGGFTYEDMEIRLSTTSRAVDGLLTGPSMDLNVGPDETLVHDGYYVLPALEGDLAVNPFDTVVNFNTPFQYNGGNLLLDIAIKNGGPLGFLGQEKSRRDRRDCLIFTLSLLSKWQPQPALIMGFVNFESSSSINTK